VSCSHFRYVLLPQVKLFRTLWRRKSGEELSWGVEVGCAIQLIALEPSHRDTWIAVARLCEARLSALSGDLAPSDPSRGAPKDLDELRWLTTAAARACVCILCLASVQSLIFVRAVSASHVIQCNTVLHSSHTIQAFITREARWEHAKLSGFLRSPPPP
jgi:hypothetical protein